MTTRQNSNPVGVPRLDRRIAVQSPHPRTSRFSSSRAFRVFYRNLGGADAQKLAAAQASGTRLPSNHSALFAPDVDPALHTGISAEVAMLRDLLKADENLPVQQR